MQYVVCIRIDLICLPSSVRSTLRGGVQSEGVHVPRPAHHAHALR